jgi:hypothetical protein
MVVTKKKMNNSQTNLINELRITPKDFINYLLEDEWRYLFAPSFFGHTTNPKTKYYNKKCYIASWETGGDLKRSIHYIFWKTIFLIGSQDWRCIGKNDVDMM